MAPGNGLHGSGAGGGTGELREELNTNLGEERGCPSLCHSMVGGGKPSARQVSRARWPGWASTTLGWFLSRSSLQNTPPTHSHQGDPLHKPGPLLSFQIQLPDSCLIRVRTPPQPSGTFLPSLPPAPTPAPES